MAQNIQRIQNLFQDQTNDDRNYHNRKRRFIQNVNNEVQQIHNNIPMQQIENNIIQQIQNSERRLDSRIQQIDTRIQQMDTRIQRNEINTQAKIFNSYATQTSNLQELRLPDNRRPQNFPNTIRNIQNYTTRNIDNLLQQYQIYEEQLTLQQKKDKFLQYIGVRL